MSVNSAFIIAKSDISVNSLLTSASNLLRLNRGKREAFIELESDVVMEDFMDLYTAAESLGISIRTFERHVEQINDAEPGNRIVKIKRSRDKKFYYSANDVNRVRSHIDSRFGQVKRPGDETPQPIAA
jgi:hypothetical protein